MSKPSERCFDSEGKLLGPWVTELRTGCEKARADLQKRELVVDLKNLTAIGQDVLLELMNERVNFHCGVFSPKHVLQQFAQNRKNRKEAQIEPATSSLRDYPQKFLQSLGILTVSIGNVLGTFLDSDKNLDCVKS